MSGQSGCPSTFGLVLQQQTRPSRWLHDFNGQLMTTHHDAHSHASISRLLDKLCMSRHSYAHSWHMRTPFLAYTDLHCIWSEVISSSSMLNSDLSAGAVVGLLTTNDWGRGAVTVAVTAVLVNGSAAALPLVYDCAPLPLLVGGAYDRPAGHISSNARRAATTMNLQSNKHTSRESSC